MKINQKKLPERTADAILYMLHSENYKVGAKLPNEMKLAERFEVSRSTIREAIRILQQEGILYTEKGSGTFLKKIDSNQETDPLGLSLVYDKKKLMADLLEIRILIEPRCAMLAAQNATRHDIDLLKRISEELEAKVENGESYVEKDVEFHQAIANCSGNLVIHNLIPYIHQSQILTDVISENRGKLSTVKEHRKIVEAIERRRGADAYDSMLFHLNKIREKMQ